MNFATKAPNFTRENAGEMARRATRARLARIAREKADAQAATRAAAPAGDDARRNRTLIQIDRLDALIDAALDQKDGRAFVQLAKAKTDLWKLVQPTAGQLKPSARQTRRQPAVSFTDETPQEPTKPG
jgi:IDEAL domain